MIATAVIAPNAASSTAQTIEVSATVTTAGRGTPATATIGAATMHTSARARDRNASSHMTTRRVRSYRPVACRFSMTPGNQPCVRASITWQVGLSGRRTTAFGGRGPW